MLMKGTEREKEEKKRKKKEKRRSKRKTGIDGSREGRGEQAADDGQAKSGRGPRWSGCWIVNQVQAHRLKMRRVAGGDGERRQMRKDSGSWDSFQLIERRS
jgi:hypothetical protein